MCIRDRGTRLSGALTIIPAQLWQIVVTGAGAGIRWCARRPRRSHDKHWHIRFRSVPDPQLAFPVPRQCQLHALHPSVGQHPTVRSLASTVRALREVIAIAANRACRRSRVPRRFHGQHPLLAAVSYTHLNGVSKKPLKKNESLRERVEQDLAAIYNNKVLVASFFSATSVAYVND